MNKIDDTSRKVQPAPLRVSRIFSAPRETVFKAWSSADHVKRWFCPNGYSVPEATVEMRVGGRFEVCMRSPEGLEHWTRGTFTEVVAPERLTIDHHVIDPCGGGPLFSAVTQVKFSAADGGTRMDVVQTYTVARSRSGGADAQRRARRLAPDARQARGGNRAHCRRTAAPDRLFMAPSIWSAPTMRRRSKCTGRYRTKSAKGRWFYGPEGWRLIERAMDFRVGGRERVKGGFEGGVTTTFDAIYHDIVPRERIVYTYEMHLDQRKISVSLATLEIEPAGAGRTKLKVCEQGAFLDGYDDAGKREHGTADLLDKLGASLKS